MSTKQARKIEGSYLDDPIVHTRHLFFAAMNPRSQSYGLFITACVLVAAIQAFLNFHAPSTADTSHVSDRLDFFKRGSDAGAMDCQDKKFGPCCASWNNNMDDWWVKNPEFEVTYEDKEKFCFSRLQDENKVDFYRKVKDLQWIHSNNSCQDVLTAFQTNSGYAASVNQIIYGFFSAVEQGLPFQITKHRPQMEWMFAAKNESSWAYCKSRDMNVGL